MTEPIERLLVVKFGDLGDALLIAPALAALRERFPSAQIDVLANDSSAPILARLPTPSRVIRFEKALFDRPREAMRPASLRRLAELGRTLRSSRYDAALLLHHLQTSWGTAKFAGLMLAAGARLRVGLDNGRGWFLTHRTPDFGFGVRHEADYWLAVAGLLGADPRPRPIELPIGAEADREARELLGGLARPIVGIHPGTGRYAPAKRWDTAGFAAVADHVRAGGGSIVLLGGRDDDDLTTRVRQAMRPGDQDVRDLAGRTDLAGLAAVLARLDLLVGNDSGVSHLAAAVGTPVVAVFGPSNAAAWAPYDAGAGRVRVVRRELACSPCIYVGFGPGNPAGCTTRECLTRLPPSAVIAAVDDLLERRRSANATG